MNIHFIDIDKLIDYARNPRKNDDVIDRMVASIKEFGFKIPLLIDKNFVIIDGHLRRKAAKKLGLKELPCIIADDLTPTQIKAFRLLANQSVNWAEWDTNLLKLELEDLKLENFNVDLIGFEDEVLSLLEDEDEIITSSDESPYTSKIERPVYIPSSSEKPLIEELYDTSKTKLLIEKIKQSSLPSEEKDFLTAAAQRFTVFNFQKIADYYAASSKEVQELFEELALVIIDFNKAIELGFVKLTEALKEQFYIDNKDDKESEIS